MKINLDYDQGAPGQNEKQLTNQELTWDYINHAVLKKYPHVARGAAMIVFASIHRKFDKAFSDKADDVDLTDEELAFLRTCVDDCLYPISLAKFVVIFVNELFKNAPEKTQSTPQTATA